MRPPLPLLVWARARRRIFNLTRWAAAIAFVTLTLAARDVSALQTTFDTGSLIIPMDTDANGQNNGMLRAYGLVYALLHGGVPVHWVINPAKPANGIDFTVPANSLQNLDPLAPISASHDYRDGPFVIADTDAGAALPIIQAWQATAGDNTVVHRLTSGPLAAVEVSRTLLGAPRIAVLKDGNESIAFNNLNAAGIPDATFGSWTASSPDQLTEAELKGATDTNHHDGVLFHSGSGLPRYCHLSSMHYNTTSDTPEVVQEVRSWLDAGPLTHAFMQCEAARVFENAAGGLFLTNAGIDDDGNAPSTVTIRAPSHPLDQIDGSFEADSGSFDSMKANDAPGSTPDYKTGVTTLINDSAAPLSERIVLLTGHMDGNALNGKVTYLAGHDYSVDLPVTANPQTNGVRLMLNSLFESDCAITEPQDVTLTKSAPALINAATPNNMEIPYTITYSTSGTRPAENLELTDVLPVGTTYVTGSASPVPVSSSGGVLRWLLPPVPPGVTGTVTFKVTMSGDGSYSNDATMEFSHLTIGTVTSDEVTTVRDTVPPVPTITSGPNGIVSEGGVTNDPTPQFAFTVGGAPTTIACGYDNTNPASWAACTPPIFTTPLGSPLNDGVHTFKVQAIDAAGNLSVIATRDFTVDLTPPNASIPGPPINGFYLNVRRPSFTFNTSGGGSITTRCAVHTSGFADNPNCSSPFQVPSFVPDNGLADGTYVLQVEPTDAAGNVGATASYAFMIDTIAPVVTLSAANPSVTSDNTPAFSFAVSAGGSPTTAHCKIDGGSFADCNSAFIVSSPLSDGIHHFFVFADDAAHNTGATVEHSFQVDTTGPVVEIPDALNLRVTANPQPTFVFTASSGGTGGSPVHAVCRVVGISPPTASSFGDCHPFPLSFQPPSALSEGDYALEVQATDDAGNSGSSIFFFTVDLVGPVVDIADPPTNLAFTNITTPAFVFTVSTSAAPVSVQCRVNPISPSGPPMDFPGCASEFPFPTTLNDGVYRFEVTASEEIPGHVGSDTFDFIVDTIPPVVVIVSPGNPEITATNTPSFSFTVDFGPGEAPTHAQCSIDTSGFAPCSSPFTVGAALSEGAHTLRVRATDEAGNLGVVATHAFVVDTLPPVVTLDPDNPTSTDVHTPTFLFTVSTGGAPTVTQCRIYEGITLIAAGPCSSPFTTSYLNDGTYTLEVTATDEANNSGMDSQTFTIATTPTPTPTSTPAGPSLCSGGPFPACKRSGVTTLSLRNDAYDARDKLKFSWNRGDPTTAAELGDPTVDTRYAVCVWDDVSGVPSLVMAMTAMPGGNCLGRPCWTRSSNGAFRYKDPGLLPDGLRQVVLKPGPLGKAGVIVKAQGPPLPDPPMPFQHDPVITVQVVNSLGNCWGADYMSAPQTNIASKLVVKEKP